MAESLRVIRAHKWAVGYAHALGCSVLQFEFSDHEPIRLALPHEEAQRLANALLSQIQNPPLKPGRLM